MHSGLRPTPAGIREPARGIASRKTLFTHFTGFNAGFSLLGRFRPHVVRIRIAIQVLEHRAEDIPHGRALPLLLIRLR